MSGLERTVRILGLGVGLMTTGCSACVDFTDSVAVLEPIGDSSEPDTSVTTDSGNPQDSVDEDTATKPGSDTQVDGDTSTPRDTGGGHKDTGEPPVEGSCTLVLGADTVVIRDDGVGSDDGIQAWICAGVTYSYTGNSSSLFAESRAGLVASGSDLMIHAKDRADVVLTGSNNQVWAEDEGDISGADRVESCEEITVDSSSVVDGC